VKKKSKKSLRKKAWKVFSEWIRKRDDGICFTCGTRKPWKQQQAGHFIHKDCLDFNERNIHCQCVRCNHFKSGELGIYANNLIKKYGPYVVDDLVFEGNQIHKFNIKELEKIVKKYS